MADKGRTEGETNDAPASVRKEGKGGASSIGTGHVRETGSRP